MVDKRKMARVMPKVNHKVMPIGKIHGEALVLPNNSGDNLKGFVSKDPINNVDFANKKYVDDQFPVTHASTTGQGVNDHHNQIHDHSTHTNIGVSDHHSKTTSGEIDHNATTNTHNLTTDIDHNSITNTHNLTTDIDHNQLTNTHNLTTDISHDSISDVSTDDHHPQVHTHTHASTTGRTSDDHHAETHTIASHDTTATGTELNTLTDDSMADTLHRHSELSASDGTPNQSVTVDATGNIHMSGTLEVNAGEIKLDAGVDVNSQISIYENGVLQGYLFYRASGTSFFSFVSQATHGLRFINTDGDLDFFQEGSSTGDIVRFWSFNGAGADIIRFTLSNKVDDAVLLIGADNTYKTHCQMTGDLFFTEESSGLQFAQIYDEDGASTLALAAQDTFYQMTAFSVDGQSNGATPDHTNDHITVTKAGKYLATINISFSQTTAVSIEYDFHIKTNNGTVDFPCVSAHRDTAGSSVVGNCSCTSCLP